MSTQGSSKKLVLGLVMLVVFAGALAAIFSPLFDGKNGLDYLDSLYNSISKGSAYYIPDLKEQGKAFTGTSVQLTLAFEDDQTAARAAAVLGKAGAAASAEGTKVAASGDLGAIMAASLDDADQLFNNQGDALKERHGLDGRMVGYTWWSVAGAMIKDLNRQKKFKEAKFVDTVTKKGLECAYNYYGIEPQKIGDRWGVVVFSLLFYVLYTIWFGFGVLFLFEGAGFRLDH